MDTHGEKKMNAGVFGIVTIFAGFSNSICGIGTGNIAIPYLSQYVADKKATGISVASTVVACVIGTLAYIYCGWNAATLQKYSLGYVCMPIFVTVSIGIIMAVPFGYKFLERLDLK